MTNTLAPAGYVITDERAIWGIGLSHLEAWADLEDTMRIAQVRLVSDAEAKALAAHPGVANGWKRRSSFSVTPATAGLLAEVQQQGGCRTWGIINGVFCTRDEQDCTSDSPV